MNSRITASSNGWVELEVTLIEGVEWGGGRRSNLVKDSSVRDLFKQICLVKFNPNYLRLDNTTPRNGKRAASGKSLCST
jgi:hypothetical protein